MKHRMAVWANRFEVLLRINDVGIANSGNWNDMMHMNEIRAEFSVSGSEVELAN